jgi:hypothetical protein
MEQEPGSVTLELIKIKLARVMPLSALAYKGEDFGAYDEKNRLLKYVHIPSGLSGLELQKKLSEQMGTPLELFPTHPEEFNDGIVASTPDGSVTIHFIPAGPQMPQSEWNSVDTAPQPEKSPMIRGLFTNEKKPPTINL